MFATKSIYIVKNPLNKVSPKLFNYTVLCLQVIKVLHRLEIFQLTNGQIKQVIIIVTILGEQQLMEQGYLSLYQNPQWPPSTLCFISIKEKAISHHLMTQTLCSQKEKSTIMFYMTTLMKNGTAVIFMVCINYALSYLYCYKSFVYT